MVLSGELGAGKTTFVQGLGAGLEVRGPITSPTFVIARVHPSLVDGPALVHVDAYRLGGIDELDDLDLDTSLDDAVTVVEWGEGIAEGLAESRLELRVIRALAHTDGAEDHDPRRVLMMPVGPRWYELEVPESRRPPLAAKPGETLLVDFWTCAEDDLRDLDRDVPLTMSILVPEHDDRVLLVHNPRTAEWELPLARLGARRVAAGGGRRAVPGRHRRRPRRRWRSRAWRRSSTATSGGSSGSPSTAARCPAPPGCAPAATSTGSPGGTPREDHAGLSAIDAHLVRVLRGS